jgi:hypothetical protein
MNYRRDGTASWAQSGVSTHQRSQVFLCQTSVITRDIVKTVRAYNEAVRVEGFLVCARITSPRYITVIEFFFALRAARLCKQLFTQPEAHPPFILLAG